ncbi:hypothetical protein QE152_g38610 [Popillia japonica]|uniref:Uncharacterized protein n=1 Tax=Popillia japonica TaxID=7064 RepID=A0AAW1HWC0_POPJA
MDNAAGRRGQRNAIAKRNNIPLNGQRGRPTGTAECDREATTKHPLIKGRNDRGSFNYMPKNMINICGNTCQFSAAFLLKRSRQF